MGSINCPPLPRLDIFDVYLLSLHDPKGNNNRTQIYIDKHRLFFLDRIAG
jgi:hypothetical protein